MFQVYHFDSVENAVVVTLTLLEELSYAISLEAQV
jgi:hypothetical protein